MKFLIRSVILVVLMTACVWVGLFYPPFWQPVNARDNLPRGANIAVLLFSVVLILRAGFRWSAFELIISQLWSPFVTMFVAARLIGMSWSETFNDFSLKRLLTQVVFICLPFLLGVLIGSLLLKCRDKFSIFPTDKSNN